MVYRKKFQYIESPRVGFYRLTDIGYEVVRKQILEFKSETPSAVTEGVSGSSTESASAPGSATQALIE